MLQLLLEHFLCIYKYNYRKQASTSHQNTSCKKICYWSQIPVKSIDTIQDHKLGKNEFLRYYTLDLITVLSALSAAR
jgi:hypothetical protein